MGNCQHLLLDRIHAESGHVCSDASSLMEDPDVAPALGAAELTTDLRTFHELFFQRFYVNRPGVYYSLREMLCHFRGLIDQDSAFLAPLDNPRRELFFKIVLDVIVCNTGMEIEVITQAIQCILEIVRHRGNRDCISRLVEDLPERITHLVCRGETMRVRKIALTIAMYISIQNKIAIRLYHQPGFVDQIHQMLMDRDCRSPCYAILDSITSLCPAYVLTEPVLNRCLSDLVKTTKRTHVKRASSILHHVLRFDRDNPLIWTNRQPVLRNVRISLRHTGCHSQTTLDYLFEIYVTLAKKEGRSVKDQRMIEAYYRKNPDFKPQFV